MKHERQPNCRLPAPPDPSQAPEHLAALASEALTELEIRRDEIKHALCEAHAELITAQKRYTIARTAYIATIDQIAAVRAVTTNFPAK